jgi:di/tricarboxylate transporter
VLVGALTLFAWGRWRYDVVALVALLTLVIAGIVPADTAFTGFGHPAVITVAAILVVSRGLQNSGLIDRVARWLSRAGDAPTAQVASTSGFIALCSGFMNNVGALALLMPATIRLAKRAGNPRSLLLMPLAFASLLGGMITVIGTPPNIIIATYRGTVTDEPFAMFDFAPVGIGIMLAGVAFLALVGWRLIPRRPQADDDEDLFDIKEYLTELQVPEGSPIVDRRIGDLEELTEVPVAVVTLIRGDRRLPAPSFYERLRIGDVLVIEADTEGIEALVQEAKLEPAEAQELGELALDSEDVNLIEAVVTHGAPIEGRSAFDVRLRARYGMNLLAVAREGGRIRQRLGRVKLQAGDVLLLQSPGEGLSSTLSALGCLPLAQRELDLHQRTGILAAVLIFGAALLAAAGLRILPIEVAVTLAALAMGFAGLVTLRQAYEAIDWSVLILLGAMIPVGAALETTGAAASLADWYLDLGGALPGWVMLTLLLVVAMLLSDVVNNAAAAVILAPIAVGTAAGLGVSADPFLMAVAVGASSAFLTPIGHQSNVLVMGPGGYRFSDYWRVGLPLEVVVVAVAVPLILIVWPL